MVAALGWLSSLIHLPQALLLLSCSLRPLDIEFLRRLCRTVNVVPVIARADSLTIEERDAFRSRVSWVPKAELGQWAGSRMVSGLRSCILGSPDPAKPENSLHRCVPAEVFRRGCQRQAPQQ